MTNIEERIKANVNYKDYIGIDVGRYKLDIYVSSLNQHFVVLNKEEKINKFFDMLLERGIDKEKDKVLITIDLTGGYEKLCRDMFYNEGFKSIILGEGLKIKNFKGSIKNNGAKTDKEDCILLAEYGKQFHSQLKLYEPRNETRETVKTLYYRLQSLKDYRQREKNRLKRPDNTIVLIKSINEHIEFLNNQIDNLKKEIMKLIGIDNDSDGKKDGSSGNNGNTNGNNNNSKENDEGRNTNAENINNKDSKELNIIYNTLLKEKGIGIETALTLICSMQELGKTERKQIASISGLAPTSRESGTMMGHRYLQGGRRDIKSAMYLCIMNMIRYDKNIKDKINEFVSKGKNKKTAICALARKKITILNAIVKKQLLLNGFA